MRIAEVAYFLLHNFCKDGLCKYLDDFPLLIVHFPQLEFVFFYVSLWVHSFFNFPSNFFLFIFVQCRMQWNIKNKRNKSLPLTLSITNQLILYKKLISNFIWANWQAHSIWYYSKHKFSTDKWHKSYHSRTFANVSSKSVIIEYRTQ